MLHISEETQASQHPSEIPWLVNSDCCALLLNSCCSPCFKNATISCLSEAPQSHVSCSTEFALALRWLKYIYFLHSLNCILVWLEVTIQNYFLPHLFYMLCRQHIEQNKAWIIFNTAFDCRTMLYLISQIKFLLCNFPFLVTDF